MKVLLSNNPNSLAVSLSESTTFAVVEAEYGDVEIKGSMDDLTLNHHIRPNRRCPCLYDNATQWAQESIQAIGISHFDLDTLGGVLACMGLKPDNDSFWEMAAFVDTNGPHKVHQCPNYEEATHVMLAAFWAWSQEHRLFSERDGSVSDVTEFFLEAGAELEEILAGNRRHEGEAFLDALETLRDESWRAEERVAETTKVLRSGDTFVNHLYYTQAGHPADIVVGFNTKFKSVTLSCSDGQINCKELVQELWGSEAGGHPGIAGSPRGREMTFWDATELFSRV